MDPFRWHRERQRGHALRNRYATIVSELCAGLSLDNHGLAVEIAAVSEHLRSFELVKEQVMDIAEAEGIR